MVLSHPQCSRPINRWCYVITGFLQNAGTRTRMIELWRGLHAVSGHASRAELRPWDSNWDAEAELIMRLSSPNPKTPPTILIFAYSWGAGWGAMRLARALDERGVAVNCMVLSDPVYRHWYWAGNWRAFVPWIPITVPGNVMQVRSFRQAKNWPRAHAIKAALPGFTEVWPPVTINATHQNMDEAGAFLTECEIVSEQFFPETRSPK